MGKRGARKTINFFYDLAGFGITSRGVEVRAPFEGREGIMSGSPRRMMDSFVQAFVRR